MEITDEMLCKLEKLSAFSIADGKKEEFKKQLGEIVNFVEILNELDLNDVDATVSTISGNAPFREDMPKESDVANGILEHAPKRQDTYFEVPKIVE